MKPWDEAIPKLRATLQKNFPDASRERINRLADEIHGSASAASALQWMERNDSRPEDDVEQLRKAAQRIKRAAEHIQSVGWHGGEAISGFARLAHHMQSQQDGQPAFNVQHSIEISARFLHYLSDEIQCAANGIDLNAPTVMSVLEDDTSAGRSRGRPNLTEAHLTAKEAASAFEELAGKPPTVITNRETGVTEGPFIEFLSDVFLNLGTDASPEYLARKICMEENQKKS